MISLDENILFINSSMNRRGETNRLGHILMGNTIFRQINLADFQLCALNQYSERDFSTILEEMEGAHKIVIGSPISWHSISGQLKLLFERFDQVKRPYEGLKGKDLYFIFQGDDPSPISIQLGEDIFHRFTNMFDMNYKGFAMDEEGVLALQKLFFDNIKAIES